MLAPANFPLRGHYPLKYEKKDYYLAYFLQIPKNGVILLLEKE